jgi:hypothetical protein
MTCSAHGWDPAAHHDCPIVSWSAWPVGVRKSVVALSCEFVEKPPGRAMVAA